MYRIRYPNLIRLALAAFVVIIVLCSSKADDVPLTPVIIKANYSFNYAFALNSSAEYVFLYSESGVSFFFLHIYRNRVILDNFNNFSLVLVR